jgi:hypothetical protein
VTTTGKTIAGIKTLDSAIASQAQILLREHGSELLYNFVVVAGQKKNLFAMGLIVITLPPMTKI